MAAKMISISVLLSCVAVLLVSPLQVQAHGGALHPWVLGQPGREHLRYPLARCPASAFKVYGGGGTGETSAIPGALPLFSKNSSATLTLQGFIDAWIYLPNNCSNQATSDLWTDLNVTYTATGLPFANATMYTYGMNGPCNATTLDLYRNSAALGDSRFNLMWVNAGVSDGRGRFWGSAVNAFRARGPSEAKIYPSKLYSLLFMPDPAAGPPMCCDLAWNAPPPTRFFNQGHECSEQDDK